MHSIDALAIGRLADSERSACMYRYVLVLARVHFTSAGVYARCLGAQVGLLASGHPLARTNGATYKQTQPVTTTPQPNAQADTNKRRNSKAHVFFFSSQSHPRDATHCWPRPCGTNTAWHCWRVTFLCWPTSTTSSIVAHSKPAASPQAVRPRKHTSTTIAKSSQYQEIQCRDAVPCKMYLLLTWVVTLSRRGA